MKDSLELIGSQKSFGGWHQRYRHFSRTLNCEMVFAIYLPPQAEPEAALTCAEAGIRVPRLADLCADGEVRYLERQARDSAESWQQVEAIDIGQ